MSERAQMAVAELKKHIDEMKTGNIDAAEFYRNLMGVLGNIEVTNEDLKGVTPQLLGFVNGLIKNMNR